MSKKLLLSRFSNKPMAIRPDRLEAILRADDVETAMQNPYGKGLGTPSGKIGVIPVYNALVHKASYFDMLYDLGSYNSIRGMFRMALSDNDIAAILLDIDSPGGEVAGAFDLVDEIYNARGTKPIYAIANEGAYSAAFAIGSAVDKFYVPRTGGLGSVGVIAMHIDRSKLYEDMGYKITPIYAGKRKTDFATYQPLSEEAHQIAQDSVNEAYELFVDTVARNRGMSTKAVRETEAAIYEGKNAVSVGFADEVKSWDQALADISRNIKSKGRTKMSTQQNTKVSFKESLAALMTDAPADEVKAALAEFGYVPAGSQSDEDKIKAEAVETAKKEMLKYVHDIAGYCQLAGMPQMLFPLIEKGVSAEDARKQILKIQSDQSDQTGIKSFTGAMGTGAKNPLIADAEQRAGK